jgi:tetratricopeptide (TPR) repeat protein
MMLWMRRLATLSFVCYPSLLFAQENAQTRIARAAALNDEGNWRSSVALLEPVVESDRSELTPQEALVAWNLLGMNYWFLGDYGKARRALETALSSIKPASAPARYAAVLVNFGTLQLEVGQNDSAQRLFLRARTLIESDTDQMAAAIVNGRLAVVAIAQRRYKDAGRVLSEAFQKAARAEHPELNDLGALYAIQSNLNLRVHDLPAALGAIQKAIDLENQLHGVEASVVRDAYYIIRGHIYGQLHEYQKARDDLEIAVADFAKNPGTNSPLYLAAESAYADLLHKSGSKQEASRLKKHVNSTRQELRRQGCVHCAIHILEFE